MKYRFAVFKSWPAAIQSLEGLAPACRSTPRPLHKALQRPAEAQLHAASRSFTQPRSARSSRRPFPRHRKRRALRAHSGTRAAQVSAGRAASRDVASGLFTGSCDAMRCTEAEGHLRNEAVADLTHDDGQPRQGVVVLGMPALGV